MDSFLSRREEYFANSSVNLRHEARRMSCAIIAAVIFAVNIKTFVRAGGLYPSGF